MARQEQITKIQKEKHIEGGGGEQRKINRIAEEEAKKKDEANEEDAADPEYQLCGFCIETRVYFGAVYCGPCTSKLHPTAASSSAEGKRLKAEAADALEKFKTTDAGRLQQEEELWTHSNIYLLFLHGTFFILFSI